MLVMIKGMSGVVHKFECNGDDTTFNLKEKLEAKIGVRPDQLQLVFGGRVIADERKVEDCGIKDGSIVHAVINLRGGGRQK